jgi:hypothetical protein
MSWAGICTIGEIKNTNIGGIMTVEDTPHRYATLQYLDVCVAMVTSKERQKIIKKF